MQAQLHCDRGRPHPAYNVKVYKLPTIHLLGEEVLPESQSEEIREAAWENTCGQFWEDAQVLAVEAGFFRVYSEGRSSGWLVPVYGTSYPDLEEDATLLAAFGDTLDHLLTGMRELYIDTVTDNVREALELNMATAQTVA